MHHVNDVYVNEELIKAAVEYKHYLGVGVPPVETPAVEYSVISLAELQHFMKFIFSPQSTNVLKQKGNDGERGCTHQLKDFAARTWHTYLADARTKGLHGLSQTNYLRMLKLPVFKSTKPEECACR